MSKAIESFRFEKNSTKSAMKIRALNKGKHLYVVTYGNHFVMSSQKRLIHLCTITILSYRAACLRGLVDKASDFE